MSGDWVSTDYVAQCLGFPPGCPEEELPMHLVESLTDLAEEEGLEALHRAVINYHRQRAAPPKPQQVEVVVRVVIEVKGDHDGSA